MSLLLLLFLQAKEQFPLLSCYNCPSWQLGLSDNWRPSRKTDVICNLCVRCVFGKTYPNGAQPERPGIFRFERTWNFIDTSVHFFDVSRTCGFPCHGCSVNQLFVMPTVCRTLKSIVFRMIIGSWVAGNSQQTPNVQQQFRDELRFPVGRNDVEYTPLGHPLSYQHLCTSFCVRLFSVHCPSVVCTWIWLSDMRRITLSIYCRFYPFRATNKNA